MLRPSQQRGDIPVGDVSLCLRPLPYRSLVPPSSGVARDEVFHDEGVAALLERALLDHPQVQSAEREDQCQDQTRRHVTFPDL